MSHSEATTDSRGQLRVSERFVSRQGEGLLTGTSSSFIRLSGCNLRCWFCDTPYASWEPDGHFIAIDELVQWASSSGPRHVVLTGGEPLLPMNVTALCDELQRAGLHLTIETAGTLFRPAKCDLLSLSPKLSGSAPPQERFSHLPKVLGERWIAAHHRRRWQPDVIKQLIAHSGDYQIKFVLDNVNETDELLAAIAELESICSIAREKIWIMPQAQSPESLEVQADWVQNWCKSTNLRYCDRAHLKWYGATRGT